VIAQRLHPEAADAAPAGRGGRGGGFQGGGGGNAAEGGQGGQDAAGRGGRGGGGFAQRGGGQGGGRGNADVQSLLDNSPAIKIADLKNGDAIVVLSTVGATEGKITAIRLLAGVEPILTKPGSREMTLGGWDLGGGGGGGGGQ
jgi:hypothetical protein